MSELDVRLAFNARYAALVTTTIDTVDENQRFKPTDPSRTYEQLTLVPGDPQAAALGAGAATWRVGFFSILLYLPVGQGASAAAQRANAIIARFNRGLTLTSGSVTVKLIDPVRVKAGRPEADRYVVPVQIPYQAFDA